MCFAPYVSLSTFIIEFLLAFFFFWKNPKDKLNQIIALLSLLLGFYQLNEFLICTTEINVFTRLALITTAILPALSITIALIMTRKKLNMLWHALIYAPVLFFVLMFALGTYLKESAICHAVFIQYPLLGVTGKFFGTYYLLYIIASILLFNYGVAAAKSKQERILNHLGLIGMLIFTVPTYVFIIFLPSMEIQFASILCEFGLLLAIELVFIIIYKEKKKIKYK